MKYILNVLTMLNIVHISDIIFVFWGTLAAFVCFISTHHRIQIQTKFMKFSLKAQLLLLNSLIESLSYYRR